MKSKAHQLTLFLAVVLFLAGCGYKESIVNSEQRSYLWFTGNTADAVVYIDDNAPIELDKSVLVAEVSDEDAEKKSLIYYQITPGKHTVVVKRKGQLLVKRVLILGNDMTKEIEIP